MTTSPLAGFDNAVLTFRIGTGTTSTGESGNPIEVTRNVTARVVLKPKRSRTQGKPGVDDTVTWFEGFWVEPTGIPPGVTNDTPCTCRIENSIGQFQEGKFELAPLTQNPYLVSLGIDFINRLEGKLRRDNV